MADENPDPKASNLGRDTDALTDQLGQTTAESAGGNVSGTGDEDASEGLDIIFEHEDNENTQH
ncbi:hypothetical protein [Sphingomonas sp. LM7]|uniref:hypothetical protein n=1 Tax=Sphingomonas sp. LM7 TaxID=1938607 RepID=UPI000983D0D0|nr:hypothetical protein [Sphingomonas sp. LM7]AQR73975.1 hypothetical protein BXU08_10225 [Sphingomonas sp. LM7]